MNLLRDYIDKHGTVAKRQLQLFVEIKEPEALHQLRVNLKKLRAVLRMLLNKDAQNKQLKSGKKQLKPFFDEAGTIRQLQLMIVWLKKNRLHLLLQQSPSLQNLPALTEVFIKHYNRNKCITEECIEILEKCSEKITEAEVFHYSAQLLQEVHAMAGAAKPDEWHELRKKMKQLQYVYSLLSTKRKLRLVTVNRLKQFDLIQEQIGTWHDLYDYKNWLNREGFYLSTDAAVKKQFSRCWNLLNLQIEAEEKNIVAAINQLPALAVTKMKSGKL